MAESTTKKETRAERARRLREKAMGPSRTRAYKAPAKKERPQMCGYDVENVNKFLISLDEDFYKRMEYVANIVAWCAREQTTDEEYTKAVKSFQTGIGKQFEDPRSRIYEELCQHMKNLVSANPKEFRQFAPFFYEAMATDFATRVEIIRDRTQALALWMAETLSDPAPDFIITTFIMSKNSSFKLKDTRWTFIRVFNIFLLKFQKSNTEKDQEWLVKAEDFIKSSMGDAGEKARQEGYKGLRILKEISPEAFNVVFESLRSVKRKKYEEITQGMVFSE